MDMPKVVRVGVMVILLGLVVAMAGCAGSSRVPGSSSSPDPTGGSGPGAALVSYARTGGIAGFRDVLVVQDDGSYEITSRHHPNASGTLSIAELSDLRAILGSVRFATIPATNPPPHPDGFTHDVTYDGHEVRVGDGAIPPALTPVITALSAILSRHGR
jgi:hypothetical protein